MAISPTPPAVDYTPAGELKIGQVGIANLRVRTLDVEQLAVEMRGRVARAPSLFARAAVIVDFGGLAATPDVATARALIAALIDAGVLPVALAYGSTENAALADAIGLPLLSKFRAQYESLDAATPGDAAPATQKARAPEAPAANRGDVSPAPAAPDRTGASGRSAAHPADGRERATSPGLIQATPVRSGQQIHAENRDLTVLSTVGAGAEVIADGSVHIYGALRGRALAGAQGDEKARIFCREFHAELVAIAGHYKVLEDIPKELHGKAVQVWLDNDQLNIAALA